MRALGLKRLITATQTQHNIIALCCLLHLVDLHKDSMVYDYEFAVVVLKFTSQFQNK